MSLLKNNIELFRAVFEMFGTTYPKRTLKRRVDALTEKDLKRLMKLEEKLEDIIEMIDEIIADRAEENKDPWP